MTCTEDLVDQVRRTLGDRAHDFDAAGVVGELREQFGEITDVAELPRDAYWWAVLRHDLTAV
jgi:hypothetical protein